MTVHRMIEGFSPEPLARIDIAVDEQFPYSTNLGAPVLAKGDRLIVSYLEDGRVIVDMERGMSGWQPIETAPHGPIIVFGDGCVGEASRHNGSSAKWGEFGWANTESGTIHHVTHWKPLPDPPVSP